MEKEWKKLIDDVENDRSYSSEPHFKFMRVCHKSVTHPFFVCVSIYSS